MAYLLDIATTDSYQELICPGTTAITVQISNAAVYMGFGQGGTHRAGTAIYGGDEVFLPSVGGLDRACDSVRVKNYTPGKPARVQLSARTEPAQA